MKRLRSLIYAMTFGLTLRVLFKLWVKLGFNLVLHQLSGQPLNQQGSLDPGSLERVLIQLHQLATQGADLDWLLILSPSRWTPLPMQVVSGKAGETSGLEELATRLVLNRATPKLSYDNSNNHSDRHNGQTGDNADRARLAGNCAHGLPEALGSLEPCPIPAQFGTQSKDTAKPEEAEQPVGHLGQLTTSDKA